MPFIDYPAAERIREFRECRGFNSAEALAAAIKAAAPTAFWKERGTVDAWTIRKIEEGHVPGPRIRFVLASYFECEPADIWQSRNWKATDKSIALTSSKALA